MGSQRDQLLEDEWKKKKKGEADSSDHWLVSSHWTNLVKNLLYKWGIDYSLMWLLLLASSRRSSFIANLNSGLGWVSKGQWQLPHVVKKEEKRWRLTLLGVEYWLESQMKIFLIFVPLLPIQWLIIGRKGNSEREALRKAKTEREGLGKNGFYRKCQWFQYVLLLFAIVFSLRILVSFDSSYEWDIDNIITRSSKTEIILNYFSLLFLIDCCNLISTCCYDCIHRRIRRNYSCRRRLHEIQNRAQTVEPAPFFLLSPTSIAYL